MPLDRLRLGLLGHGRPPTRRHAWANCDWTNGAERSTTPGRCGTAWRERRGDEVADRSLLPPLSVARRRLPCGDILAAGVRCSGGRVQSLQQMTLVLQTVRRTRNPSQPGEPSRGRCRADTCPLRSARSVGAGVRQWGAARWADSARLSPPRPRSRPTGRCKLAADPLRHLNGQPRAGSGSPEVPLGGWRSGAGVSEGAVV